MFDASIRTRRSDAALVNRVHSPVDSTFSVSRILPKPFAKSVVSVFEPRAPEAPPALPSMSSARSISPDQVFDGPEDPTLERYTSTIHTSAPTSGDEQAEYDLKPPPPSVSHTNVEVLAERFYSIDHLNLILRDPTLSARFSKFVHQFRPQSVATLNSYVQLQKAALAIEYANAIATRTQPHCPAAVLVEQFEDFNQSVVDELLTDVLPAALTHQLVRLVCDSLVKEITQTSAPVMREMIPSLAEVYCVSDPSLPDNPIVYASEEFYKTSQYGRDYAIGRNCRFLQGPKTSIPSVKRLIDALATGQEITETILNYRRDGTPFMNLLLIAPLYDNKGTVRYFLGCQIDVSPLIEAGRGVESFAQLLAQDRAESRFGGRAAQRDPNHVLGELGSLLNDQEAGSIRKQARSNSVATGRSTPQASPGGGRRVLGMEDAPENLWPHDSLGPSGRLPGVYQNYLLVRPYPSLRITFTSPALRIPGLLQTKFLDRIGGPQQVREGILDSLAHGTSVTAKVSWLTGGTGSSSRGSLEGKPRWLHCTPLLGSDDKVGVWMVVMVENEEVTGSLNAAARKGSMSDSAMGPMGAASPRYAGNSNKLYTEYLRREGRDRDAVSPMGSPRAAPVNASLPSRGSSARRPLGAEPQPFHDF